MKHHLYSLFAVVFVLLLSIVKPPSTAALDCTKGVTLRFVGFEYFGVARFEVENTLPVVVDIVGFRANWVQYLPPGVFTLERATMVAPLGQPGAVELWNSGSPVEDANPPTISNQEGQWVASFALPPATISPFLLDFSGTGGLLSDLGFVAADFNGTSITVNGSYCDVETPIAVGAPVPSDGRLNFGIGDWQAVIYAEDGAGNAAIHIYGVNENSEGYILLAITAEQLEALPKNPSENLLIAQVDDPAVAVYLLTTGEYQVNIGPDAEGKVDVFIFTGLPLSNMQHHWFNINDILYPED